MCIRDSNILEDAKRFHTIGCSAQTRNGGEKYIPVSYTHLMCIRDSHMGMPMVNCTA